MRRWVYGRSKLRRRMCRVSDVLLFPFFAPGLEEEENNNLYE